MRWEASGKAGNRLNHKGVYKINCSVTNFFFLSNETNMYLRHHRHKQVISVHVCVCDSGHPGGRMCFGAVDELQTQQVSRLVSRMQLCFGGTFTGMEPGTGIPSTRAAQSWQETSGVRDAGDRRNARSASLPGQVLFCETRMECDAGRGWPGRGHQAGLPRVGVLEQEGSTDEMGQQCQNSYKTEGAGSGRETPSNHE